MNKIKYLVLAFVAVCLTAAISSCEKEKEVEKIVEKEVVKTDTVTVEKKDTIREPSSNWERYQQLVTADVKSKKKNGADAQADSMLGGAADMAGRDGGQDANRIRNRAGGRQLAETGENTVSAAGRSV